MTRTRRTGMNTSAVRTRSTGTQVLCILLVDDHEPVRLGLRSILEGQPSWTICPETTDREVAVLAEQPPTDVVVIDIQMPKMDVLRTTQEIPVATPQIKVVVLTGDETKEVVQA